MQAITWLLASYRQAMLPVGLWKLLLENPRAPEAGISVMAASRPPTTRLRIDTSFPPDRRPSAAYMRRRSPGREVG